MKQCRMTRLFLSGIVTVVLVTGAEAQTTLSGWSVDAGTPVLTGGGSTLHASMGQSEPLTTLHTDHELLEPGFLGGIALRPNLDTDADGLCDEVDPDNDGDDAWDLDELTMQTNPMDASSVLKIVDMVIGGGQIVLYWQAREGAEYQIYRGDSATNGTPTLVPGTITAPGPGSPPWYEVQANTTIAQPAGDFVILRVVKTN